MQIIGSTGAVDRFLAVATPEERNNGDDQYNPGNRILREFRIQPRPKQIATIANAGTRPFLTPPAPPPT
jgi:hypothetical protein